MTDAEPIAERHVRRIRQPSELGGPTDDRVALEEPLEIRIAGESLAVTMRSPGDDHHLALGFLLAEGIIRASSEIGGLAHCGDPTDSSFGNVIEALPAPGIALDPERLRNSRRGTLVTAACGVCGRRSIDDLLARCPSVPVGAPLGFEILAQAAEALARSQPIFEATGAVHAALAVGREGELLASAEDVGRHNAVDKVVGALLEQRRVGSEVREEPPALLMVSGRVSFEIVQKAAVARIPVVAGVSGPTSLAIDLAEESAIALLGFVRDGTANLYTHAERIRGQA